MRGIDSQQGLRLDAEPFAVEKKELEAVLESGIFAASSNAAKLLRFVCDRYFHNGKAPIPEYDVAVHALSRRSDFDPQRDSIVRVEAHRVRKRLQEYYDHEGASHKVKIVLSRGQYAPRFVHAEVPEGDAGLHTETALSEHAPAWREGAPSKQEIFPGMRTATYAGWRRLPAVVAVAAALAVALLWSRARRERPIAGRPEELAVAVAGDTVRILTGLASGDYVDRFGTRWSADAYFDGGTAAVIRYHSLALADDPAVYQHARTGENFGYDIPLRPATYKMRLRFVSSPEVALLA